MKIRSLYFCFLIAGIALLTGCVEKSTNGDISTFKYQLWVLLALLVGGAVAIFISRLLPDRTDGLFRFVKKVRLLLLVGGVVLILGSTWCYFDKVTVSPTEITEVTGMWGSNTKTIPVKELVKVELIKEESGVGRKKSSNFYLMCSLKDGSSVKFPINNKNVQTALPDIVDVIKSAQVPIINTLENQ
jgi:hypothetical protein